MATDEEIQKARKKLKKQHAKYLLMNQEKMDAIAYKKKHGRSFQDAEYFKKLRSKRKISKKNMEV